MLKKLYSFLARPRDPAVQAAYANFVAKALARTTAALIFLALLVASLSLLSASAAHAGGGGMGGGATEVTQMMNNTELAMQTMESTRQTVEMIEHTYLQRLQQMKQSIGEYTAPFQDTYETYAKIMDLNSKLGIMQGDVNNLQGILDNRYRQFSASSLSWDGWKQREALAIQAGDQRARAELESNRRALENVNSSMGAYQKAAAGMEGTQGVHQAVRQLAPMLTMLGGDVNKLITITAQANAARAEEQFEKRAREAADLEYTKKFQQQLDAERESRHQFLNKMGGKK